MHPADCDDGLAFYSGMENLLELLGIREPSAHVDDKVYGLQVFRWEISAAEYIVPRSRKASTCIRLGEFAAILLSLPQPTVA